VSLPDTTGHLLDLLRPTVNAATNFTVNSTGDGADSNVMDSVGNDGSSSVALPATAVAPAPISGTKSVCPSGCNFLTITAAIADIHAQGLGGPLTLELASTYVSSGETFPLPFTNLTGASSTNTVTVRPAIGATNLAITSANSTATVNLDNANYLTIDGRAGGVGTSKELTIENTATDVALKFIDEASNNTVRYVTFKGVHASVTSGVVVFSTTTGAGGNDNNTIDNCDIRDGATTPSVAVYSLGTTTTKAQANSGNIISNSHIFNFYNQTGSSTGIALSDGNTDWTITGNSFYQTANRVGSPSTVAAISIVSPAGNNFTVTHNIIGGTTPSAGGTAWTINGSPQDTAFIGINLRIGGGTPSTVQNNTVKNFSWLSQFGSSSVVWRGILIAGDKDSGASVSDNLIGEGIGTGSISVTTTTISFFGFATVGIESVSLGAVSISNNTIGSITTNGMNSSLSSSLMGMRVTEGTVTISGNTVGSTTSANSLNAATASTSSASQQVIGIQSDNPKSTTISGNTVANLNNNYAGTIQIRQVRGIVGSLGVNTIIGNTVRNLSSSSQNPNQSFQELFGIEQRSLSPGQTISRNVVHSLSSSTPSALIWGIYYDGNSSGTNVIERNLVHSLSVSSTGASSQIAGFEFGRGSFTAQNNMVRVGIDASGTSTSSNSVVLGIVDKGSDENRNYYHNSVFVGGTQTSGAANSFAFRSALPFLVNRRTIRNNIFVNARSNSGATGRHYAVNYGGTTAIPATGLSAGSNIFFVSGTGGVLGLYNGVDYTTLPAWQNATGVDEGSAVADPLFVNPTAGTPDLHLQPSNPAEMGGFIIPSVTDDFDGEMRNALTPVDIGADAGNFVSTGDIFAPTISYAPLMPGSSANRTLTGFATIADNSGIVSGGQNLPRLYFKRTTDADVFGGNSSAVNGWKFVTASNATSPYSFTIDYSILFNSGGGGGSVSVGDTVQYFIVAQDVANNLSSNPAGASASGNPPVQNINAKPALVNSYSIRGTLSGAKTVCASGCDYPNLTGASGIFAAINNSSLTGNLVISISGDLSEDGTSGLNKAASNDFPQSSITIRPADGTPRTIAGNVANGMIRLDGADRITIDGRFNNAGRFLRFRNTNSNNPTITLKDASNNTIRSSIIEGATTNPDNAVVFFSPGAATGNDANLVSDNQIRDRSDAAGIPGNLIKSIGSRSASGALVPVIANSDNVISSNEIFNFSTAGISIDISSVYFGNDSWTLQGNNIYQTVSSPSTVGISFGSIGTNTITQNLVHDLSGANGVTGISVGTVGEATTTVSRNRINSLSSSSTITGISCSGTNSEVTVANNQISLTTSSAQELFIYGLFELGQSGSTFNSYFNSILVDGTALGTRSTWACYRRALNATPDTSRSNNNICFNNRTGGTGNHFAAGNTAPFQGGLGGLSSNYNVFVGTGSTAANFMDFGVSQSGTVGTPVSFATWQSSTGGDSNSQAGNPGGAFTSGMFVNPTAGDLHMIPAGNPLVSNTGTPVASVTTDYDNDVRSSGAPDIGSDEFVITNPIAHTPSVTNASTNANTQTTSGLVISRNPLDGAEITHFKITGITGGALFKNNGTTPINNGDFITFAEGNAGLKFTPGTTNGRFNVQASTSASDAGLGGGTATATITINPGGGVIRFSASSYNVAEGAGVKTITVERTGDVSQAATVDYATSDHSNPADFIPCTSPGPGLASSRCDFTTAIGTLRFAAGEASKTLNVLISQDNYVEGPESLSLTLSNPTGGAEFGVPATAILEISDDLPEPATNPVDTSSEFVRSQYHDFLHREPDLPGLAFWTDNIQKCNDPLRRPANQTVAQCIDKQRESTAIAFFVAPELQMSGGFVYHLYKGSLTGTPNYDGGSPGSSPGRFPTFLEFMRDMGVVSEGIGVNNQISGAVVEANRNRLAAEFVLRPEFVAKYGGLNNTLYVQELFNTTGITATAAQKQALVDGLTNATETRASVLRKVVDGTVVISESNVQSTTPYGQAFINQENRRLFVYLEYVGYLRRNPDAAGFVFWLGKLNFYNGDPFQAEMVRSFILSPEYRSRFGTP
jgi:hypothetical protein